MNHLPLRLLLPILTACAAITACDTPAPETPTPALKKAPERIVSFSPGMTEIAYDLGLGPKVVGVSRFATFPPEVERVDKVGGMMDPNLEKTLALRPDLILAAPSVRGVEALAKDKAIPIVLSRTDSLDDVFEAYADIGAAGGAKDAAKQRVDALKAKIDALTYKGDTRPKVLLVIGRDPGALTGLYAAGPGSFLDELLTLAGGANALPAKAGKWPKISLESLLTDPPDLILEFATTGDPPEKTAAAKAAWKKAPALTTAQKGHVHAIVGDHVLLPGPRLVLTLDALGATLKPYRIATDMPDKSEVDKADR